MTRIARWAAITIVVLFVLGIGFILTRDNRPHGARDVRLFTSLLNEIAAIDVPHNSFLTDDERRQNAGLLGLVESGTDLSPEQSQSYRRLMLATLHKHQSRLVWLDSNLTVLTDVCMDEPNNVGGSGIAGRHDHHDVSARRNFADLVMALEHIDAAGGVMAPFVRVYRANQAYKNLTDIILHLAVSVHSVSVPYRPPEQDVEAGSMAADFEAMLVAYKVAQFAPVNGTVYVAQIGRAMDAYDRLVLTVQARINQRLSPLERRLAGRWLAIHTVAPQPDRTMTVRFPR